VSAPWRWGVWWRTTLALGAELGDQFGVGLLRAAGCDPEHLDLKGKVGGDRPTALLAVAQLMRAAKRVTLAACALTPTEALHVAEGIRLSSRLTALDLSGNRLVGVWFEGGSFMGAYEREAIETIAQAVRSSGTLTMLDLSHNSLGSARAHSRSQRIAHARAHSR
jgi:hypothetical protein